MHDKYAYEAFEMSLHDGDVERIRATGIAGLSIVADSLAAIRDTKVRVIRDERGLAVDFEREGEYVPFGRSIIWLDYWMAILLRMEVSI